MIKEHFFSKSQIKMKGTKLFIQAEIWTRFGFYQVGHFFREEVFLMGIFLVFVGLGFTH